MFSVEKFCVFAEKYGLFILLLLCFQLLPPDLSVKASLMDRDLEAFNQSIGGSDSFKQIFWIASFLVFCLCFAMRGLWFIERESLRLLIGWSSVLFVCFLSLLWSQYPSYTIKRAVFQVLLVFSLSSAVCFAIKQRTFAINIRYFIYIVIFTGFAALIVQGGIAADGFTGWAKTKNSFGGYMLGVLLLLYLKRNFEVFIGRTAVVENGVFLSICMLFMVLSYSKTSIALSVLLLMLLCLGRPVNKAFFLAVFTLAMVVKVLLPGLANVYGEDWNIAMLMSDGAFTGRGYIWKLLYADLYDSNHLALGYGYGAYFSAGETPEYLEDAYSFVQYLNSAHSSYIELVLQLGFIFTIILLLILARMVTALNNSTAYICSVIIVLHGLSESGLLKDAHAMWVLFIISLAYSCFLNAENRKNQGA